jgi:hypothetical protein
MPNGTAGSQTTTALTLTFNQTIPGLGEDDITLATGSTGTTKGSLVGTGGGTYTLAVTGVKAEGDVTVTMSKHGYVINPATIRVPVYYYPVPLATGGIVTYDPPTGMPPEWEIHTFDVPGTHSLTFDIAMNSVAADYLIVAGGGGAGGGNTTNYKDFAGGGGAGGLLYKPEAILSLQGGSVIVTVGTGGAGGVKNQGANGEDSAIGDVVVPGGGGGGSFEYPPNPTWNKTRGLDGGSGGGGSAGGDALFGTGGQGSNSASNIMGNNGGNGAGNNSTDGGGSGGGAGGAGVTGRADGTVVAGGNPWNVPGDASWIQTATGKTAFSRGGNSGGTNGTGANGVNYGDGGSGGGSTQSGGTGHSGIVVIRFQRSAASN